ncbi:MAG TPA: thiol reductant ABC exporter subunit CydD [Ktedonobacteraceae bacterium]|nr:thiol reductant ABC exporter subunit CydD [Ktedonobacteraceae bacterium]
MAFISSTPPERARLSSVLPRSRRALALAMLWGVPSSLVTIVEMFVLSTIISRVFLQQATLAQLEDLLGLLLAGLICHAVLVWGREVSAQQAAITMKADLRRRLFAHLLRLGPAYVQNERAGELGATLSEGIERLDAYVSRYLPQIALSVLVPLLILLAIFPLDWLSALLLLLTAPLIPFLIALLGSKTERAARSQWTALAHLSAHLLDMVQGLTTLKLFGRARAEQARVAHISEEYREKTMQVLRRAFLSGAGLEFLVMMAIGLIAIILGIRLLRHSISLQVALFVLLLAPEFYRPLRELGASRHAAMEGKASALRIGEILEAPLPLPHTTLSTTAGPTGSLEIVLHNVSYTYPGSERPALSGINLTLPACSCTALVGRSGAGKSTLTRLLLRFIECDQGTITANGIPINELPVELWREYVALVPQRPYLFYETVRENIRLARPSANEKEILQAAEQAGALEFIRQLPQGFETLVGEQGMRLSAGQVQRIAIARAFLKDAPLLILDEPSSSLDPESEYALRHALERLMQDRTVLVIAHRLNTIAAAGQVVVLEKGRGRVAGTLDHWLRSEQGAVPATPRRPGKRVPA